MPNTALNRKIKPPPFKLFIILRVKKRLTESRYGEVACIGWILLSLILTTNSWEDRKGIVHDSGNDQRGNEIFEEGLRSKDKNHAVFKLNLHYLSPRILSPQPMQHETDKRKQTTAVQLTWRDTLEVLNCWRGWTKEKNSERRIYREDSSKSAHTFS